MIKDWLEEQLSNKALSSEDFSELLIRLLDYGVICRDESLIEQKLYDRFSQCEDIIEDYLSLLAIRIDHNRRFQFVRAFPPGAKVPGLQDEDQQPFNNGMRARLTQMDVALVMVLRIEYAKQLREGNIDDKGCTLVAMESISISFNNLIKKSLPDNLSERKALFRHLRQLRLIHYQSEEDLDSGESWLRIRPAITSYVSDEAIDCIASKDELMILETEEHASQIRSSSAFNQESQEPEA